MATSPFVTMQQRRGLKANLPTAAPDGQLLIATDTKELFFGTGTGVEAFASDVSLSRTRFVALTGSNTTGNGSINKPYATISAALASITDATTNNRYVIRVAPGVYSESTTVLLKANVYIVGDHYQAVRYNANFALDNASFAGGSDHRSGMSQMFVGSFTGDFKTALSTAGKLYFEDVTFTGAFSIIAYHSVNQCLIDGSNFFGAVTFDGNNSRMNNCVIENGAALNLIQSTSTYSTVTTQLVFVHSYATGAVNVTGTTKPSILFLYNSFLDSNLTINGANATVHSSMESAPNKSGITLTNGGQFFRKDDAFSIAFTPADASKWSTVPNNVLDALDTLATTASSSSTYTFTQSTAAATWNINHGLNKRPSVMVVDSSGQMIFADILYVNDNNIQIKFSVAVAGFVYLN